MKLNNIIATFSKLPRSVGIERIKVIQQARKGISFFALEKEEQKKTKQIKNVYQKIAALSLEEQQELVKQFLKKT